MAQVGCLLWMVFFIVIGFSMMPKTMTIVVIFSFIAGLLDGLRKNRKNKKSKKPNFKLEEWEKHF